MKNTVLGIARCAPHLLVALVALAGCAPAVRPVESSPEADTDGLDRERCATFVEAVVRGHPRRTTVGDVERSTERCAEQLRAMSASAPLAHACVVACYGKDDLDAIRRCLAGCQDRVEPYEASRPAPSAAARESWATLPTESVRGSIPGLDDRHVAFEAQLPRGFEESLDAYSGHGARLDFRVDGAEIELDIEVRHRVAQEGPAAVDFPGAWTVVRDASLSGGRRVTTATSDAGLYAQVVIPVDDATSVTCQLVSLDAPTSASTMLPWFEAMCGSLSVSERADAPAPAGAGGR